MKKASMISILVTTFFYLCCGCFGYAAFGKDAPGNLVTGFGFYEPYWLIGFATPALSFTCWAGQLSGTETSEHLLNAETRLVITYS
jgi:hypothetical protein